ncbi:MAG: PepSY domain-containing protein [Alcaligenaceae bacterium]|nr:PepSY domain-containing protein [Alcaligenaceae bacterium]
MVFSVLPSRPVHADVDDHEQARQALMDGKVMSLRTVLEKVEKEYGGQIVKIEFEHDDDDGQNRWLYEIKLLQDSGDMLKLLVDAENGKILKLKGKTRHNKTQDHD